MKTNNTINTAGRDVPKAAAVSPKSPTYPVVTKATKSANNSPKKDVIEENSMMESALRSTKNLTIVHGNLSPNALPNDSSTNISTTTNTSSPTTAKTCPPSILSEKSLAPQQLKQQEPKVGEISVLEDQTTLNPKKVASKGEAYTEAENKEMAEKQKISISDDEIAHNEFCMGNGSESDDLLFDETEMNDKGSASVLVQDVAKSASGRAKDADSEKKGVIANEIEGGTKKIEVQEKKVEEGY